MLKSHGRYSYSPITARPDYTWPDGSRLAVYIGLNLEHFEFGDGLGATLAPGGPQPDVLNFAWRDYGNRVGAWRLLELFEALGFPVSLLVNSELYDYCPALIEAYRNAGAEIVAHGRTNSERQGTMGEAEEKELISSVTATIEHHEGKRPTGWLGPWISESVVTPDLLQECGYEYVLDWSHDDQPTWLKTRHGRILSIPYPQEVNDIPAIAVRHASAPEFAEMISDQFDELYQQARSQPLVCGIALHPYIVGQPFRLRHLRSALAHIVAHRDSIWLCRSGDIAAHVRTSRESVSV